MPVPTTTGRPRSAGLSRCSIEAKKASMSRWAMTGYMILLKSTERPWSKRNVWAKSLLVSAFRAYKRYNNNVFHHIWDRKEALLLHYIIRRLLLSIPLLIGITVITFLIIHLTPGSPVVLQTSMNAKVSAETQDRLKKLYGLDKPIPVQYVLWIKRLVTGDFGDSFVDMRPVSEKILERLPATLELNILSLLIIFGVAVPLGIYSASRSDTLPDKIFTVGTFASYSLPSFWLGLLIMLIFGLRLNWLPISGMNDMNAEYLPFF